MQYKKVNEALAKEFGVGQVEVRKAPRTAEWEYTIWFLDEEVPIEVVEKAKAIVNEFEPTFWMDDKMFYSER
jgi:hypothetical protein